MNQNISKIESGCAFSPSSTAGEIHKPQARPKAFYETPQLIRHGKLVELTLQNGSGQVVVLGCTDPGGPPCNP